MPSDPFEICGQKNPYPEFPRPVRIPWPGTNGWQALSLLCPQPIPALLLMVLLAGSSAAQELSNAKAVDLATPREAAAHVDNLIAEELASDSKNSPAKATDDYTFLCRVSFDLLGHPPTIEEINRFVQDPAADKRERLIDQFLESDWYGDNWARYWRDVIIFRRSDQRGLLGAKPLQAFLTQEFNRNTPWDQIAREMITASGDVRENGATGLIMAQMGRPEETVAELSRVFLGIQIQCAQCHDHPFDRWEREQFHELAAFFPRVAVRPSRKSDQKRTFAVVANDRPAPRRRQNANNRYRGTPEHRMPDLDDPSAQGEVMTARFFLTGESLELGRPDADAADNWPSGLRPRTIPGLPNHLYSDFGWNWSARGSSMRSTISDPTVKPTCVRHWIIWPRISFTAATI